jgi:hypothetical protein
MNRLFGLAAFILTVLPGAAHACSAKQPEDFSAFFEKFIDDKEFALSRTIYPSVHTRYEYRIEDGKQQITELRRKVGKQDDAKYPPLGVYMKSFGLEPQRQDVAANEAVVEVSKSGVQGFLSYHFSSPRGCWFLREVQNHSL